VPKCFVIMPISTPSNLVSDYGGDPDHLSMSCAICLSQHLGVLDTT
jgi:hypothetical protein